MKDEKAYSLSKDEIANLRGRTSARDYLMHLIDDDIENYINEVVKKRLDIPKDQLVTIDFKTGTLTIVVEQQKP